MDPGWFLVIGSLVVKAGCTFKGYHKSSYSGDMKLYEGPVLVPNEPGFSYGRPIGGFGSFFCECDMNYINCIPEDNYEAVLYCDASSAQVWGRFDEITIKLCCHVLID